MKNGRQTLTNIDITHKKNNMLFHIWQNKQQLSSIFDDNIAQPMTKKNDVLRVVERFV